MSRTVAARSFVTSVPPSANNTKDKQHSKECMKTAKYFAGVIHIWASDLWVGLGPFIKGIELSYMTPHDELRGLWVNSNHAHASTVLLLCHRCEQIVIFRGLGFIWIGYVIASYVMADVIMSFIIGACLKSCRTHAHTVAVVTGQLMFPHIVARGVIYIYK